MISKKTVAVAIIAILAGAASFFATRAIASREPVAFGGGSSRQRPCRALTSWMQLSAEQTEAIGRDDPDFEADCVRLDSELMEQRMILADLLAKPSTPKADILGQVEQVITTHNALERRVAQYLLVVRDHLSADQQKQLMGLCAKSVRNRPCSSLRGCKGGRCKGCR